MATPAANSTTDPYLSAYYAMQTQNVKDNYGMQMAQNAQAQNLGDISFSQKLQALNDKLGQEQNTFEDPYASRGLLNSGIFNNDTANTDNMGAKQLFAYNSGLARSNLNQQQQGADAAYQQRGTQLNNTMSDQLQGIQQVQAADQARSAINDAITAGG